MKLYYDAKDRPIEPPAVLNDNDDFAPEISRAEEPLDETSTVMKNNQHSNVNKQDKCENEVLPESDAQIYQIEKI